ncbi:TetR family transcriptional regulator [Erwinia sp. OLTSP20]|uniref:TetR/AcrR family transcriptional regulator n=1 Tax=unclassified Erwinia TaxID=2622719 RepID=UPI000C180A9B|nr:MULTISPECIES: TetR/AcrR family transcriptional regulator [unclassified Erwinia]PIJ51719.1 TetR family transcriptional regulator [Erwinia sp. OAMSP11]PIJ75606.1 TetR family transcriptional regulator [Erwinia sp. OLSSP12]PIJ84911.1 TetR family transcriptional regulator [Erwinia sp. OLCASP19]PIJ86690.1 TetR family transcriptional regulator [Erwinia sp. OLMTSP26]PIJ88131.1 TetR family transcriptional regulator [Erwinia sp. OLMDSP33]
MARPKSEDKKLALLNAATRAIAESGIGASTAQITRYAGVAEGTLFRYFASKDALLNALYLHLKLDLGKSLINNVDLLTCSPKIFLRHLWHNCIDWGAANPYGYLTMRKLAISEKITDATREQVLQLFPQRRQHLESGLLPEFCVPPFRAYSDEIFLALVETTIKFITAEPTRTDEFKQVGFDALWRALGKQDN